MNPVKEKSRYRKLVASEDLVSFEVCLGQTELFISAPEDMSVEAGFLVSKSRRIIEEYARRDGRFKNSFHPVRAAPDAHPVIKDMCLRAAECGVGPMASVAGAIAEFVGRGLLEVTDEVIVENGGDIFMKADRARVAGIYAGDSAFSGRIGIEIDAEKTPCGICASSGSVGHSINFGSADAVVVLSRSSVLADAAATACSNMVKGPESIEEAIGFARSVEGVRGIVVVRGNRMGAWGDVRIKGV